MCNSLLIYRHIAPLSFPLQLQIVSYTLEIMFLIRNVLKLQRLLTMPVFRSLFFVTKLRKIGRAHLRIFVKFGKLTDFVRLWIVRTPVKLKLSTTLRRLAMDEYSMDVQLRYCQYWQASSSATWRHNTKRRIFPGIEKTVHEIFGFHLKQEIWGVFWDVIILLIFLRIWI